MSAPTPPERSTRPERVGGIFVAIAWAALVFAVFGVLSVMLDRDPIEVEVSPLYGVVSLILASVVVYLGIIGTVPARSPWLGACATAGGVYLMLVVSGAAVQLGLGLAQATSPFVGVAALLAAAAPVACWVYFVRGRT